MPIGRLHVDEDFPRLSTDTRVAVKTRKQVSTHLSVNINWICRRSVNLQLGFSIFCDLSDERHRGAEIVILIRVHVEETDGFLRCGADGAGGLKVFAGRLEIFLVAWWIKILEHMILWAIKLRLSPETN